METWQTILLVLTLIYGIAFGFRNVILKIKFFFKPTKHRLVQAELAQLLDAAFIVSLWYCLYLIVVKF